jgi:hypothetical protein
MLLICLIQRRTIEHFHVQPFACSYDGLSQTAGTPVCLSSASFNQLLSSAISQSLEMHGFVLFAFSSNFKRADFSQNVASPILMLRIQAQLLNERISPYICPLLIRLSQQCFDETKTGVLNASRRREFS